MQASSIQKIFQNNVVFQGKKKGGRGGGNLIWASIQCSSHFFMQINHIKHLDWKYSGGTKENEEQINYRVGGCDRRAERSKGSTSAWCAD